MIGLFALIGATFSEFPEWKGEFDEYVEDFSTGLVDLFPKELIADQENRTALLAYVSQEVDAPYSSDAELEELLTPLIPKGSTIIDRGMGLSPFLSKCTGDEGRVYAFEPGLSAFSQRYWQLVRGGRKNVSLYCAISEEKDRDLDEYGFEKVDLLCIHCQGREDLFLEGATETIKASKPILLIDLLGGLCFEDGDRFIKEELNRRIEMIQKRGYVVKRIRGDLHLALPL